MSYGLTAQQSALLGFIRAEIRAGRQPPTLDEMGAHLGHASKGATHAMVKALEVRGHIRRLSRKPRAIELVEREPLASIQVPETGPIEIIVAPGLTADQRARIAEGLRTALDRVTDSAGVHP